LKPLLEFQMNGSFNVVKTTIDGMTDEEWTSRAYPKANVVGFTLWHCLRTIDWAVNGVAAGGDEMAEQPQWRDVKPDASYFGAGLSTEKADWVARTVGRRRAGEYLEALRAQSLGWLRSLPADDLNRIVDLQAHTDRKPDHMEPAVWAEIEDLNGIPLWQFLARPCVSHIRVHFGEVTAQLEALRAAAPS
jgi:hypothetical protein